MANYNIPVKGKTSVEVCESNEGRKGGHFPIGNNKCWHCGMHIYYGSDNNEILPLIEGELSAYRIEKDYQTIPLEQEISWKRYYHLNARIQNLYHNLNEETDETDKVPKEDRKYTLKKESITEAEYSGLQEDGELYRSDGNGGYKAVRRIASNFILIKHKIPLPVKELEFYTLYMGLRPGGVSEEHKKYLDEYHGNVIEDGQKPLNKKLPFYMTWKFKLASSDLKYNYFESKEGKIFIGSHCEFSIKRDDAENYDCEFINIKDKSCVIPKRNIKIIEEVTEYKPKEDRVSIFHVKPRTNGELFKIGELKLEGTYFTPAYTKDCEVTRYSKTHYQVNVGQKELHPNMTAGGYTWWYKGTGTVNAEIPFNSSVEIYYRNNDIAGSHNSYKIIKSADFKETVPDAITSAAPVPTQSMPLKYITIESRGIFGSSKEDYYIIINKENTDMLFFYYKGKKVIAVSVEAAKFRAYNGVRNINELEVVRLSRITEGNINKNEYIKLISGNEDVSAGDSIRYDIENLKPCRLACRNVAVSYQAIVRKDDLYVSKGKGILEKLEGVPTPAWMKKEDGKEGVILHDGPSGDDNVRDIILKGEEFIPASPASLHEETKPCAVEKDGLKYAGFTGSVVEAKICYEDRYGGEGNKIIKGGRKIKRDEVLGYPNEHQKRNSEYFYDLACFFKGNSFLSDESNKDNEKTRRYILKPETKVYKQETKTDTGKTGLFPWGTTFSCEEVGGGEEKVYKLTVKSVNAFIGLVGMPEAWKTACENKTKYKAGVSYKIDEFKDIKKLILYDKHVEINNYDKRPPTVKWLGENFVEVWKSLEKTEFKFAGYAREGNPRFNIPFPEGNAVVLWVIPEEIDKYVLKSGNVLEIRREGNPEIKYYEENPKVYKDSRGRQGNKKRRIFKTIE